MTDATCYPDNNTPYWLCCGSKVFPHGESLCNESRIGYPEHVRWGTAKQHSDWQKFGSATPKEPPKE